MGDVADTNRQVLDDQGRIATAAINLAAKKLRDFGSFPWWFWLGLGVYLSRKIKL